MEVGGDMALFFEPNDFIQLSGLLKKIRLDPSILSARKMAIRRTWDWYYNGSSDRLSEISDFVREFL